MSCSVVGSEAGHAMSCPVCSCGDLVVVELGV